MKLPLLVGHLLLLIGLLLLQLPLQCSLLPMLHGTHHLLTMIH